MGLVTAGNVVSSGIITAKAFIPNEGQLSNRNLVINGDFAVAQRGISTTSGGYGTVDRWQINDNNTNVTITQSQHALTSSDSEPWDLGFRSSYHIALSAAGNSLSAASYIRLKYVMEAQDIAKSGWDYTNTARDITLSFWFKCSKNQQFYGKLNSGDGTTKDYSFGFTATGDDTWTKITKVIPGHADLQFDLNDDYGLGLYFALYYGTDSTGSISLNTWRTQDNNTQYPDMVDTWITSTTPTFEITGVQIEVGSVATPFEHRPFRDELLSCQRYYVRKGAPLTPIGDGGGYFTAYTQGSSNKFVGTYWYPIQLRGSPSSVEWSGIVGMYGGTCDNDGEMVATAIGNSHNCDTSSRIHLTVSSVSGGKGGLVMSKSTSGYFAWSAEL